MAIQTAQPVNDPNARLPFLWGTSEQRIPIATIPFVAGAQAATVKIPKNGYLLKMIYRFVGTATVGTVGTAGVPYLPLVINRMVLSYNGGFQYRTLDGESLHMAYAARYKGPADPVLGSPNYVNYSPTSATAQPVSFVIEDAIGFNTGVNADKYLLAAQARNADVTLDVTFGTSAAIAANTEAVTLTGTLYVEGVFLMDPDYSKFAKPDLSTVQQWTTDTSYTSLVGGDNVVPIVPINGPKYLGLLFKVQTGASINVFDVYGPTAALQNVRIKVNNGLEKLNQSEMALLQENFHMLQRALGRGFYYLDFASDVSLVNVMSKIGRNVISTTKVAQLWLILTMLAGTYTGGIVKLVKRVEMPTAG